MGALMILLQRFGLLQPKEAAASRFDERLIRTCQRERMLSCKPAAIRT